MVIILTLQISQDSVVEQLFQMLQLKKSFGMKYFHLIVNTPARKQEVLPQHYSKQTSLNFRSHLLKNSVNVFRNVSRKKQEISETVFISISPRPNSLQSIPFRF
jgi:hypothetical protein